MPPAIPGALEGVLPAAQISIGGRLAAAPGAQSAAAARLQSATGAALQERCAEDHRPPLRRMRGALVLGAPAARCRIYRLPTQPLSGRRSRLRSEERRVGKECMTQWRPNEYTKDCEQF